MNVTRQKTIWWWIEAAMIGGLAVFTLMCAERGPPRGSETKLWAWPVISVFLAVASAVALARLYRIEPYAGPGLWQLEMLDLVATAFFAGLNLAAWQAGRPSSFLAFGLISTACATGAFVAGMLAAARMGLPPRLTRWSFAACYILRLFGALSLGGVCVLLVVGLFFGENPIKFLQEIYFRGGRHAALVVLRAGTVCFLPGWLGCAFLVNKHLRRPPAAVPEPPHPGDPA
ncbi:MAG: hypothetical protein KIS92_23080 [Planctomycetota bacterium]|nr:hypothetical protein [Planctomycetota bacterium]